MRKRIKKNVVKKSKGFDEMIAYRYDFENNKYVGEQLCQRDPVASAKAGKDIYLLPGNCTYAEPPDAKEGYNIVWNGEAWEYEEIPVEPEPEPPEPPEIDPDQMAEAEISKGDMLDMIAEMGDTIISLQTELAVLKGE